MESPISSDPWEQESKISTQKAPQLTDSFVPPVSIHTPMFSKNVLFILIILLMISNVITLVLFVNPNLLINNSNSQIENEDNPAISDNYPTVPQAPSINPEEYPINDPTPTPKIERNLSNITVNEVEWLTTRKKISPLPIFIDPQIAKADGFTLSEAEFYHIASMPSGGRLIDVFVPVEGMGTYIFPVRIIETADQQYIVQKYHNNWEYANDILLPNIDYITSTIKGWDMPETINANNIVFTRDPYGYAGDLISTLQNPQKIADTDAGPLYQDREKIFELKDLYGRQIFLQLKDNTIVPYSLKNVLFSDDRVAMINWSDGRALAGYEALRTGGCGAGVLGVPVIVDNSPILSGLNLVGKTQTGDPIYQLTDPNNELVKFLYKDSYASYRDNPLTINEFATTPNHFIWQDKLGDWQFFINQNYAILAECAKPVIYLYPQTQQSVSVKVGANIRQSEPLYPKSGWQVIANPSGLLSYQGQTYPYLFWDGIGHGLYPNLSKRGTVVEKSNVEKVLRQQLSAQGLNSQESQDFLDFWLPLMPTTPYTRLTWLTTSEMNELAPLQVSPQPTTTIRVFLDYQGLDRPQSLTSQTFISPVRSGFVLVEWGGLKVGK